MESMSGATEKLELQHRFDLLLERGGRDLRVLIKSDIRILTKYLKLKKLERTLLRHAHRNKVRDEN